MSVESRCAGRTEREYLRACGVVNGTSVGGTREMVTRGRASDLTIHRADGTSETVRSVRTAPQMRRKMAERVREHARDTMAERAERNMRLLASIGATGVAYD